MILRKPAIYFLFVLFVSPLIAQQEADTLKVRLDDVTVFGEEQQEFVIEVPTAVNIIPVEQTKVKGVNLKNALTFLPGVAVQSRDGGPLLKLTIRGYGARSNAPQTVGLKILVDGFPETEPDGRTSLDLIDLASIGNVEVIRSNASAIHGAGAGGAINFRSNTSFDRPFFSARSSFGSFGFLRNEFRAGVELENANALLTMTNTNYDGWRGHSASTASYAGFLVDGASGATEYFISLNAVSSLYKISGPLTAAQYAADRQQANARFLDRDERRHQKLMKLAVRLQHEITNNHALSFSAYINPRLIMRSQKNTYRDFNRHHIGGRLAYTYNRNLSGGSKLNFTAGIDNQYQTGNSLFYTLSDQNLRGDVLDQNKDEGGHVYGAFGAVELLFKKWALSAGIRYSVADYAYEDFMNQELTDHRTYEHLTPSLGVSYLFTPLHSVYVRYAAGTENPAFNEVKAPPGLDTLARMNPLLESPEYHSFEIGAKGAYIFKSSWLKELVYDAAVFLITAENEILPFSSDGANYYITAGETRRTGAEALLQLATHWQLDVTLSASLLDYTFTGDIPGYSLPVDGNNFPGVPGDMLLAKLDWRPLPDLTLSASMERFGTTWIDNENSFSADAYSLLHLHGSWEIPLKPLLFTLFAGVDNLLDEEYVASVAVNDRRGEYYEAGLPRNYFMGLSAKIGL